MLGKWEKDKLLKYRTKPGILCLQDLTTAPCVMQSAGTESAHLSML